MFSEQSSRIQKYCTIYSLRFHVIKSTGYSLSSARSRGNVSTYDKPENNVASVRRPCRGVSSAVRNAEPCVCRRHCSPRLLLSSAIIIVVIQSRVSDDTALIIKNVCTAIVLTAFGQKRAMSPVLFNARIVHRLVLRFARCTTYSGAGFRLLDP